LSTIPAIKVDDMEIASMPYRLLLWETAHFTTAIARMLGKAVKFRYCPATVSAPVFLPVLFDDWKSRISARVPSPCAKYPENH